MKPQAFDLQPTGAARGAAVQRVGGPDHGQGRRRGGRRSAVFLGCVVVVVVAVVVVVVAFNSIF